jgi:ferric-dicitrate binding protein FerR (iron transport regulator)
MNEELMARYFSGALAEEERKTLLSWLNESRENEERFFLMKDIYDAGNAAQLYREASTAEGWRKLLQAIAQKQRLKKSVIMRPAWMTQLRRYAAILVIGVLSGMAIVKFFSASHSQEPLYRAGICEIRTGKGERVRVTLPDGSGVILNACSFLSYPGDFGSETRQLQFFGEGYFEVQTNADMPFVVQTAGLNIKAYGTTFNVKAYTDENVVETTLVEGSVTIEDENSRQIVILQPDQAIVIPKKTGAAAVAHVQEPPEAEPKAKAPETKAPASKKQEPKALLKKKIETEVYTSWKDSQWIIRSETLESLARKMERRYDVTFTFQDAGSREYVFSGTLKDYPLEQILEVIRLNAPIQYTVKEKSVIIREDRRQKEKYKQLIR